MARRASTPAHTGAPSKESQSQAPKETLPVQLGSMSDFLAQEEVSAELPTNPSLLEDRDYEETKKTLGKYERALERRIKGHNNEIAAVSAQKAIVDEHVATLASLQGTVGATPDQIEGYTATIAELSQRQAAFAAQRAAPAAPSAAGEASGVMYARNACTTS